MSEINKGAGKEKRKQETMLNKRKGEEEWKMILEGKHKISKNKKNKKTHNNKKV